MPESAVFRQAARSRLLIRLAGSDEYSEDLDYFPFVIGHEKDPVITDSPAEDPFPFVALETFHFALEGIRLHLCQRARDAFLDRLWQAA